MHSMTNTITLIARVLLALLFIVAGLGKLGNVEGFAGYMASGGLPAFLAWPAIAFEILGGIAILIGFQTRIVAYALAAFCVVTGLMFHFDPADQMQMTQLLKNLALAGGYLLLGLHGAGALSVDAKFGRTGAATA